MSLNFQRVERSFPMLLSAGLNDSSAEPENNKSSQSNNKLEEANRQQGHIDRPSLLAPEVAQESEKQRGMWSRVQSLPETKQDDNFSSSIRSLLIEKEKRGAKKSNRTSPSVSQALQDILQTSRTTRTPQYPLTFGVEIEFCLAYLPENVPNPDPTEYRTVHFAVTDEVDVCEPKQKHNKPTRLHELRHAMAKHIGTTLVKAGFPAQPATWDQNNYAVWELATDSSIVCPNPLDHNYDVEEPKWEYMAWELRSPAYYFTPLALQSVERVCALLASTYMIHINETTGMHVHVGNRDKGFHLNTIRNLQAFFFAFEPQLLSAYPPHRVDAQYMRSSRRCARLIGEFCKVSSSSHLEKNKGGGGKDVHGDGIMRDEHGRQKDSSSDSASSSTSTSTYGPTPWQAVQILLAQTDRHEIISLGGMDDTDMVFSFRQLRVPETPKEWRWQGGNTSNGSQLGGAKQTIEFRGHDSTFDCEEIRNGIKTAVGIVEAMRCITPECLRELVSVSKYEVWQRTGVKGHAQEETEEEEEEDDANKEAKFGVPLAEGGFTLVDLLRYLGIYGPAKFYARRGVYRYLGIQL
ncbi:hypothetical protein B7463_g12654, partial [Scytalidium lignicola]